VITVEPVIYEGSDLKYVVRNVRLAIGDNRVLLTLNDLRKLAAMLNRVVEVRKLSRSHCPHCASNKPPRFHLGGFARATILPAFSHVGAI
jgi:hypothetical protein